MLHLAECAEGQRMYFDRGRRYTDIPGAFIERLPSEERKVLKQLQSKDIEDVRVP